VTVDFNAKEEIKTGIRRMAMKKDENSWLETERLPRFFEKRREFPPLFPPENTGNNTLVMSISRVREQSRASKNHYHL
jgi:hypothetical protein